MRLQSVLQSELSRELCSLARLLVNFRKIRVFLLLDIGCDYSWLEKPTIDHNEAINIRKAAASNSTALRGRTCS